MSKSYYCDLTNAFTPFHTNTQQQLQTLQQPTLLPITQTQIPVQLPTIQPQIHLPTSTSTSPLPSQQQQQQQYIKNYNTTTNQLPSSYNNNNHHCQCKHHIQHKHNKVNTFLNINNPFFLSIILILLFLNLIILVYLSGKSEFAFRTNSM